MLKSLSLEGMWEPRNVFFDIDGSYNLTNTVRLESNEESWDHLPQNEKL